MAYIMHGTRHLSSAKEYIKRAVSPGRMNHHRQDSGKNEGWRGDTTPYLMCERGASDDVWMGADNG